MPTRFVLGVLLLTATPALAGPQYVDGTGFAVSGYDVVAYRDLPAGAAPVPGRADVTAAWNGVTWAFATAANRDRFLADPQAYVPAYDGHCAYGVASGYKVPANPGLWTLVDGRLYLNYDAGVQRSWEKDVPGLIAQAEGTWPALESGPASADPVPAFDTAAAPLR